MSDGDPVAWLMIEPGLKVVDADDNQVGHVEEVVGDQNADIFSGLLISTGLFSGHRFVPAEQVGLITEEDVHLRLTSDQVKQLTDKTAPG
jgi:uncharacterized protein YrrD